MPYRTHPTAPAIPLAIAGLYAVHAPVGAATHIYYCEPATGRCSCGAAGSCPHIAVARAERARAARALTVMEEVA